jgi:hypothetical protein
MASSTTNTDCGKHDADDHVGVPMGLNYQDLARSAWGSEGLRRIPEVVRQHIRSFLGDFGHTHGLSVFQCRSSVWYVMQQRHMRVRLCAVRYSVDTFCARWLKPLFDPPNTFPLIEFNNALWDLDCLSPLVLQVKDLDTTDMIVLLSMKFVHKNDRDDDALLVERVERSEDGSVHIRSVVEGKWQVRFKSGAVSLLEPKKQRQRKQAALLVYWRSELTQTI